MAREKFTRLKLDFELSDGTVDTVTVHNRSMIAWDETRARRQWPQSSDAPFLFQTFIAWHALSRSGRYAGDFNQFQDDCLAIEGAEDEAVDPTPPAEPGI